MSKLQRGVMLLAILYGTIFGLWELDEHSQPGQQYADPFWPVLICTGCFSPFELIGAEIYDSIRGRRE